MTYTTDCQNLYNIISIHVFSFLRNKFEVDDFEKCSGLNVFFSKTEATWIGINKFNKEGSFLI